MTQADDLLRELARSVPSDDEKERAALDAARQALLTAIASTPHSSGTRARQPRAEPKVAKRLGYVAALAAVLGLIVALFPTSPGRGGEHLGPSVASARAFLEQAARAVAQRPWQPLGPREWFRFREVGSSSSGHGPAPERPTVMQESWFAANGFARVVQTGPNTVIPGGDVLLFHATARELHAEQQRQQRGAHLRILAYSQRFRWVDLDYDHLTRLPSDPTALQRYIEEHAIGGGPRFSDVFSYAEALLGGAGAGGAPLPPKVSAAMYRVIARLPNMRLIGPTRDPLGRPGVAIGLIFRNQPGRLELILDPKTGTLLGERSISLSAARDHAPPGTILAWSAIVSQGVAHSLH